ncbi:hypothetical protein BJ138DRAFT_1138371 [Hygrophoropsis aurantiaca]|uniref:Uncharacterized protein n=1 Tax=Hygrophoropsis aurantiaca TaxID=72124 RepID=A0ACB7ZV90_9AGAM|nr:hypothetical protein BJ138DRAFT_1138371 [Hygrophoropsis aurantiaca]
MTAQSNNGNTKSWVLHDEHKLQKKGAGRGIHWSDVICSTIGHLTAAGQSLEYGKNYEGYWNGEIFVKQAHVRNGWFIRNGVRISQSMVYSSADPQHPNQPKGIKAVLVEHSIYQSQLRGKCPSKCEHGATACCNKHILELQPDFVEQTSLVQEVIEKAGHVYVFLPKFHCELNFIEFFWGRTLKANMSITLDSLYQV